jgi:hypothetical protein
MVSSISGVSSLPTESPRNISAPTMASARVFGSPGCAYYLYRQQVGTALHQHTVYIKHGNVLCLYTQQQIQVSTGQRGRTRT